MRQIFTLLAFVSLFNLSAQDFNFAQISPTLEQKINDNASEAIDIYILLADQVDALAMKADFERREVTLAERSYELITALEAKANATQGPLIEFLRNSGIASAQIQPFWVTNMIQVSAAAPIIAELSRRSDVQWLESVPENILFDVTVDECESAPSPNGHEIGHEAIKATKMWEMGYTGYGQIAMIVDTGTDGDHPALYRNFRGLYFPGEGYSGSGPEPTDCDGHGSHVTGTVVGLDRMTRDTVGVAFGAHWMGAPAELAPSCSDARSPIAHFQFALNPDGDPSTASDMPAAVNNSWGTPPSGSCFNNQAIASAMTNLEVAGVAVVFAAGNDGPGPSSIGGQPDINFSLVNAFSVGNLNANNPSLPINFGSSRGPSACGGTGSLLIKPEVSAPGTQIRSCNANGGYWTIGGTSMASPHVAGAILLLKEAFPELTGEEIKLALYFSATDLGTPGEDNTYGMGIINLEAAFDYLVNEGNTPVDPTTSNDVIAIQLEMDNTFCSGEAGVTGDIIFENAGTNTLTSLDIQYEIIAGGTVVQSGTYPWTGSLAQNERATFTIPETAVADGKYDFVVTFVNPNNMADEHELNNKLSRSFTFAAPVNFDFVADVQPCIGSNALVTLDLSEDFDIQWYLTLASSAPIGTGPSFLTPPIPGSFTFYIEAQTDAHTGIPEKDPTSNDLSAEGGLVFDVVSNVTLKSVKVYAETNGPRLINLRTSGGNQVASMPFFVTNPGEQVVDLNFAISPGEDYELSLGAGADLHYTANPEFPYSSGSLTIKRSNDFTDPESRYPFFYDWVVEQDLLCGRVPIFVQSQSVSDLPVASFESVVADGSVDFTNNSSNGVSYLWQFGDGSTSTDESPVHVYAAIGTYEVILTTFGPEGCSDTEIREVVVETVTDISEIEALNQISVFPNPTKNRLNISFDFDDPQEVEIAVVDVLGRVIKTNPRSRFLNEFIELDLADFSEGIYYVLFDIDGVKVVEKVVKMK
ncbi:MAG: S8 family serine peptidase [Bacteroidota bacterium]